mgnify:FL=1
MEKKETWEIDSEAQLLLKRIVPPADELAREGWESPVEQRLTLESMVLPC